MKLLSFATAVLACAACGSVPPVRHSVGTAPAPAAEWTPPPGAVPPPQRAAVPAQPPQLTPGTRVTLAQIIDVALANNSQTRIAWLQARSAEAALGSRQAAYLPEVDLNAGLTRSAQATSGGGTTSPQTVWGPSLTLTALLFDFGGRAAQVDEARQALIAANFTHNQAIQDVILRTQEAYYSYLDAKALLAAQESTIKERQAALDAAEARHRAGVATIADVLQAKTARSQAELNRESIAGSVRTIEGALATAMGLPATTRFDFGELPLDVPAKQTAETVDALIERAVATRPELAAARASAERASARIREVRSQGLPTIGVTTSAGETLFGTNRHSTPYSAGVSLRFPLFTGFRNEYDVRQAEIDAQTAAESVRALEQQVDLQVWSSYFALQTATQRLGTARDLLASAAQSAEVASSRYRAGVGSILDLLTAEAALESARAQEVQSRSDWFIAVAQLAHDTGSLDVK